MWTKRDNAKRKIAMPNEIFDDLKEWYDAGELKSPLHREFTYSYYWIVAYLWRYAKYADIKITQRDIKKMLGYNPNDKRLDYIIKKNGLLDSKEYTESVKDFPITWEFKDGVNLSLFMWSDLDESLRQEINHFKTNGFTVKSPKKSIGTSENEGLFTRSIDSHALNGKIFKTCMTNKNLSCAGFYLCGLFVYMRNVNRDIRKKDNFVCTNSTLVKMTGWSEHRVIRITNELSDVGLISKFQEAKMKGYANIYTLNF